MTIRDETRWLGPPPGVLRTASIARVWRWSRDDEATHAIGGATRFDGRPDDPRLVAPGFLQPGLALVGGSEGPLCALGRHPRWIDEQTYEESLLVPTPQGWIQGGLARTERAGTTLLDAHGTVRARRRRDARGRREPLDEGDRLVVGSATHRLEAVTVGGRKGFWSFLSPPECVGVRWLAEAGGAVVVEAATEGLPCWRGDVTHPVVVRWSQRPDPWARAAMLQLLASMIDLSDGIHTD